MYGSVVVKVDGIARALYPPPDIHLLSEYLVIVKAVIMIILSKPGKKV